MLAIDNTNGNKEIDRPLGRRVMLLAGVNDAPLEPNLPALSFAESSTKDLSDMLQTTQCGFELYVSPLLGRNATVHAIRTALLDAVEDLGPNDLLVFYFCGHGLPVKIKADELDVYLVSYDFK